MRVAFNVIDETNWFIDRPREPWTVQAEARAAGRLDDDPGMKPDKHIFIEVKSPWFEITDDLPQLDLPGLIALRAKTKMRD